MKYKYTKKLCYYKTCAVLVWKVESCADIRRGSFVYKCEKSSEGCAGLTVFKWTQYCCYFVYNSVFCYLYYFVVKLRYTWIVHFFMIRKTAQINDIAHAICSHYCLYQWLTGYMVIQVHFFNWSYTQQIHKSSCRQYKSLRLQETILIKYVYKR